MKYKDIFKNWKLNLSTKHLIIIITIFFLMVFLKNIFTILLLFLIGGLSMFHKKYKFGLGVELVTFSSVICGIKFGPLTGFIIGFFSSLFGFLIGEDIHDGMLLSVFLFGFIGLVSGVFPNINIFILGLTLAVMYDLFFILKGLLTGL